MKELLINQKTGTPNDKNLYLHLFFGLTVFDYKVSFPICQEESLIFASFRRTPISRISTGFFE